VEKIPPFRFLDALRGLAALWVVMAHASTPFIAGGNQTFLNNPIYFISSYGALGVVIFFVISGYCITGALYNAMLRGHGTSVYLHDRVRRIYPPYLATCLLALCIAWLLAFAQHHHLAPAAHHEVAVHRDLLYWFSNLTLTQLEFKRGCLVFVFWSLCYEIVFYVLLGLFYALFLLFARRGFVRNSQFAFFLMSGVFFISMVSECWLVADPRGCPFPLDLWYQFGLGSLLFLDVAARHSGDSSQASWTGWALGLCAVLAAAFAWLHDLSSLNGVLVESQVLGHPSSRVKCLLALLLVGFLIIVRRHDDMIHRSPWIRPLKALGMISYSLYLTHAIFLPFVDAGLRRAGLDHGWYFLNYLAQLTVAVMVGFVFYHVVERHFVTRRIGPEA